jgi:hypothetical protein
VGSTGHRGRIRSNREGRPSHWSQRTGGPVNRVGRNVVGKGIRHCSGNRGKSPERYTRQEVLSGEFANVLKELIITPAILEWLADAVLDSDRTEHAARAEGIKRLKARYDQIENRIETMYLDQLDGRITQEFFDKYTATQRRKQDALHARSKISRRPPQCRLIRQSTCCA